jgi:hypothetical protein
MALPDVLQWLGSARKTGVLELEDNRVTTRIYYREGRIVACSSEDPPKLIGQYLLFHGEITEEVLRRTLSIQETTGRSLRDILEEESIVSRDALDRIVASKAQETILSLFQLEEATFAFIEDKEPPATAMDVDLEVQDLLLHGMKRLDDMERIRERLNLEGVPFRTGSQPHPGIAEDWPTYQIYRAIDGRRTIRDLMLQVHGTEFQVCERLLGLCEDGYVEIAREVDPPTVATSPAVDAAESATGFDLELVRELIGNGEFEACFEMLGAARRVDPTDTAVCDLLSKAEEALLEAIRSEGLTPSKVPIPVMSREETDDVTLTPEEEFLLSISDGSWDVKSLIWVAPMRAFQVLSALNGLWERGLIEITDPEAEDLPVPEQPDTDATGARPV